MKCMPIMYRGETAIEPLPWDIIKPHEEQAQKNHRQSLATLASRGGLSPCEAVAILEDRRWRQMNDVEAINRLAELVRKEPA